MATPPTTVATHRGGSSEGPSSVELEGYFQTLSNWGRWGPDDTLGTLNLITPTRIHAAAKLIERGVSVSCSRAIAPRPTQTPSTGVLHMMTSSGEGAPEHGMGSATDWIGMGIHGFDNTHLDSHAHVFWNAQMYNGRAAELCSTERGATVGGLEPLFRGVAGRGVLIDGPALRMKPWLDPGEALYPADLDAWCESVNIIIQPGDVVYVRTGREERDAALKHSQPPKALPGLHASCLPWLRDHDVALLGSDVIHDVQPSGYEGVEFPIHAVAIVAMGMWLIDNASFRELTALCKEQRRYEFFTLIAPLAMRRATGSPVNPIVLM